MTEDEARKAIVAEAKTWIGTRYVSNGMVKEAGTDCAMILVGVYGGLGLIPPQFDPRPYPAQWHLHRNIEKYLEAILAFATEVEKPPKRAPKPGDVVMFKIGKVFAHAAIITDWPNVIHAVGGSGVLPEDISKNNTGKRALANVEQRFFSLWA